MLTVAAGVAGVACLAGCTNSNAGQRLQPGTKTVVVAASEVTAAHLRPLGIDSKVTYQQVDGTLPEGLAPSEWITSSTATDSTKLLLDLSFGDCGEHHHETIYVRETTTTVLIDVWDGPTTDNPSGVCAGVERSVSYTVHLKAPLRARHLLTHQIVSA
jgi:hypothetical protein